MNKTITMTCMNRPGYTSQVLESIKNQNKPLDDYTLYINIDTGNNKEVVKICEDIDFIKTDIKILTFDEYRTNRRVNKNTYDVVNRAFETANYNLYLEDDIVLSPDALDLMDWYIEQDLTDIASLCLCNLQTKTEDKNILFKSRGACFWGFVINRCQFELYFSPAWFSGFSWDTSIARFIRTFEKAQHLIPRLSRSINIGEHGVNNTMHWEKFMKDHKYNQSKEKFNYEIQ